MLKYLNNKRKKGQSTLEYAILIIIILGALLSIQVYIKRSVQGGLKSSSDDIGDQFSPGNTNAITTTRVKSTTRDTFVDGTTSSKLLKDEETITNMEYNILNVEAEFWGGV